MGSEIPKPYLPLQSVPILVHTLRLFQHAEIIRDIYLVVREEERAYAERRIIVPYALDKVREIVVGGRERQDSIFNALRCIRDDHDIVLVHDGVRPMLTEDLLCRIIEVASKEGAATAGLPVKDTIKEVNDTAEIERTLDRRKLYMIQTPQAFRREIIVAAYNQAYRDNFYGTDDASLVERMNIPVKVIMGNYENIKITTPEDLLFAESIMAGKSGGE